MMLGFLKLTLHPSSDIMKLSHDLAAILGKTTASLWPIMPTLLISGFSHSTPHFPLLHSSDSHKDPLRDEIRSALALDFPLRKSHWLLLGKNAGVIFRVFRFSQRFVFRSI